MDCVPRNNRDKNLTISQLLKTFDATLFQVQLQKKQIFDFYPLQLQRNGIVNAIGTKIITGQIFCFGQLIKIMQCVTEPKNCSLEFINPVVLIFQVITEIN